MNPPLIFGPILGPVVSPDKLNEPSATLYNILTGNAPQNRPDVANAHLTALTNPDTNGERLFTV